MQSSQTILLFSIIHFFSQLELCVCLQILQLFTEFRSWADNITTGQRSTIIQSVLSQSVFTVSTYQNESLLDIINTTWTEEAICLSAASQPLRKHPVRRTGSLFVLMINVYTWYKENIFQLCLGILMSWQQKQTPSQLEFYCKLGNNLCSCDRICYSSVNGHCSMFFLEWAAESHATKRQNCWSLPMSILSLWLYLITSNGKT